MKAEELMIGDWADFGSFKRQVIQSDYCQDVNGDCILDGTRPIPLTVEILESNGFEKKGHRYGIYDDYFDFEMYEYNDGTWLVSYHCCEMSLPDEQVLIFHVHQLQHFMRHCAIDKVFKLEP